LDFEAASVMGILAFFPPLLEDKQKTVITVNLFESKKNFQVLMWDLRVFE